MSNAPASETTTRSMDSVAHRKEPVQTSRRRDRGRLGRRSPYLRTTYRGELAFFPYSGARIAGLAVLVLALVAFPLFAGSFWIGVANLCAITAIAALGVQIVTGMAGQLSLGHAAFLAIGGFTAAGLHLHLELPLWIGGPAAMLAGALVGMLAGVPALRLRGFYLGITTLAVQYVVLAAGLKYQSYLQSSLGTGGSLTVPAPDLGLVTLTRPWHWYVAMVILLGVVLVAVANLRRSDLGRSFLAVRQGEVAAEALGINVAFVKITAFALSGALGGLAGALFAYYYRSVSIENFDLLLSVTFLAMVIIGGLGSIQGAVYGAIFVTATPHVVGWLLEVLELSGTLGTRLRAIELGVFALTMMAFLLFEPEGLAGVWQRVKSYFTRWPFRYTDMTTTAKR